MNEISIDKLNNNKTVSISGSDTNPIRSPIPEKKPIIQLEKNSLKVSSPHTTTSQPPSPGTVVPLDDLKLLSDPSKIKTENVGNFGKTPSSPPISSSVSGQNRVSSSDIADISDILGQSSLEVNIGGDTPSVLSPTPNLNSSIKATTPDSIIEPKKETSFFSSIFNSNKPEIKPSETKVQSTTGTTNPNTPNKNTTNTNTIHKNNTPIEKRVPEAPVPPPLTESEKQKDKQELLFRLGRLKERGFPISKNYSMSSSYDEILQEFHKIKAQKDLQNSVKFQRKMMMAIVTGVEFLNTKFDPFDVKLDGWSESVHENSDEYDDIFEELHDKYKEKAKMAPEMRLFLSITGSAFMFHLTQSLFKTVPNVEDVLKQNPDLMKQFAQTTVNNSSQNYTSPSPPSPKKEMGGGGFGGGFGGILSNLMGMGGGGGGGGGGNGSGSGNVSDALSDTNSVESVARNEMSGPIGMDDILNELSNSVSGTKEMNINRLSTVHTANPQDIQDHQQSLTNMKSSGYRRKTSEGVRLNI